MFRIWHINLESPVFKNRRFAFISSDCCLAFSMSKNRNTHNAGVASSSLALATIIRWQRCVAINLDNPHFLIFSVLSTFSPLIIVSACNYSYLYCFPWFLSLVKPVYSLFIDQVFSKW